MGEQKQSEANHLLVKFNRLVQLHLLLHLLLLLHVGSYNNTAALSPGSNHFSLSFFFLSFFLSFYAHKTTRRLMEGVDPRGSLCCVLFVVVVVVVLMLCCCCCVPVPWSVFHGA